MKKSKLFFISLLVATLLNAPNVTAAKKGGELINVKV